jgi:hypothetical protein
VITNFTYLVFAFCDIGGLVHLFSDIGGEDFIVNQFSQELEYPDEIFPSPYFDEEDGYPSIYKILQISISLHQLILIFPKISHS